MSIHHFNSKSCHRQNGRRLQNFEEHLKPVTHFFAMIEIELPENCKKPHCQSQTFQAWFKFYKFPSTALHVKRSSASGKPKKITSRVKNISVQWFLTVPRFVNLIIERFSATETEHLKCSCMSKLIKFNLHLISISVLKWCTESTELLFNE